MASKEQRFVEGRINATDKDIEIFVSRLESFLGRNLKDILKGVKTGRDKALSAAQILGGIRSSLLNAGLTKEVSRIDAVYGGQLRAVADSFADIKKPGEIFADADYKVVESLINIDTKIMEGEILKTADQVASVVMRQVITGTPIDADEIARNYSEGMRRELQTEANTSISGFYRSITQAKAKELDITYYAYVGPNDGIIRPFCKARINKIYTREQIKKWDNGTRLPADIYAGGYNCRHDLVPMSDERAKQRVDEGTYTWG